MNKQKIIEKQDELIKHLYKHLKKGELSRDEYRDWYKEKTKIESELSSLKAEAEKVRITKVVCPECKNEEGIKYNAFTHTHTCKCGKKWLAFEAEKEVIYQKCHQCGNELPKELHCPECGNNFPCFNVSQKHLPTDEEIENQFPITSSWNNRLRQEGAKAMRDGKIKPTETI